MSTNMVFIEFRLHLCTCTNDNTEWRSADGRLGSGSTDRQSSTTQPAAAESDEVRVHTKSEQSVIFLEGFGSFLQAVYNMKLPLDALSSL